MFATGGAPSCYSFTRLTARIDSDDLSFFYAQRNVASNDLATRISVVKVDATQPFLAFLPTHSPILDFSICNPPFYSSTNEMATLTQAKQLAPAAVRATNYAGMC